MEYLPEDVKKVFNIINTVTGVATSFRPPRNIPKNSGRKGDRGNPRDQSKPRNRGGNSNSDNKKDQDRRDREACKRGKLQKRAVVGTSRVGKITMRTVTCGNNGKPTTEERVFTSAVYAANAQETVFSATCSAEYTQPCHHYSSVVRVKPAWASLTCPPEAATKANSRARLPATASWEKQHRGKGWRTSLPANCQRDEYPPAYLLTKGAGYSDQLVRYLPGAQNGAAGNIWQGVCFADPIKDLSDAEFERLFSTKGARTMNINNGKRYFAPIVTLPTRPVFSWAAWNHQTLPNDGLDDNPCWPSKQAPNDPGFALLTDDPYYGGVPPPYDYQTDAP
jgi:hypothetical protein